MTAERVGVVDRLGETNEAGGAATSWQGWRSASHMSAAGSAVTGTTARYLPCGGTRLAAMAELTEYGYTGHHANNSDLELVYMNARYYAIYHAISPDTIIPNPANPQSFNRYAYALGNPIRYADATGHCAGSPVNSGGRPWRPYDESTEADVGCWRLVWEIYGEWNRNTAWASRFRDLETFWRLAHMDSLDLDYRKRWPILIQSLD